MSAHTATVFPSSIDSWKLDLEDPTPTAPDGVAGPVNTLLGYGAWVVTIVCVIAVLACAARMAMSHKSGGSGEHIMSLGWIMMAAILVGSAASLVNLFLVDQ